VSRVQCVVCGGEHFRQPIFLRDRLGLPDASIRYCYRCGLGTTTPRPAPADIDSLYPEDYYRPAWIRGAGIVARAAASAKRRIWSVRWSLLDGEPRGRVLDVGCGNGQFLAGMRSRGWETVGIDYSPSAVEIARQVVPDVRLGGLENAGFERDSFDVVTLFHVLEHVEDPSATLHQIRHVLKDGGALVVEVPNVRSLASRLTGTCWQGLDVPRHLYHFSPRALELLHSDHGFRIERKGPLNPLDALYVVYRSLSCAIGGDNPLAAVRPGEDRRSSMSARIVALLRLAAVAPIAALMVAVERMEPILGESQSVVCRKLPM
jgi:2-polyprenyl-3-methyl-5-hydroxy-6-metoxy-1,4-benzoquinol methylase